MLSTCYARIYSIYSKYTVNRYKFAINRCNINTGYNFVLYILYITSTLLKVTITKTVAYQEHLITVTRCGVRRNFFGDHFGWELCNRTCYNAIGKLRLVGEITIIYFISSKVTSQYMMSRLHCLLCSFF